MESFLKNVKGSFGITLTPTQVDQFNTYELLLLEWNKKINLTSIKNHNAILHKHFFDSLSCIKLIPLNIEFSLIDIGTGAGFPGIPLRIINPLLKLTLCESTGKKTEFCEHVIDTLQFTDAVVVNERAETLGGDDNFREKFDWAVSRAVAPLNILAEYMLPLIKIGGSMLAQKGNNLNSELDQAFNAIELLGGRFTQVVPVDLPENIGMRNLVHIRKINSTPQAYPRRPGIPKKKPLL